MSRSMIQWCLLAVLVLVGVVAVTSGSASGSSASPGSEPVVSVASVVSPSAAAMQLGADEAPVSIPADLQLVDEAQPMACEESACFAECNATGWCEGTCVAGACKCRYRRGPGSECP